MTRKLLPDGWEVLEVFPEKDGETILTVYDNQDNVDSVRVVVWGKSQTGGETGSGIIFQKKHLNISDTAEFEYFANNVNNWVWLVQFKISWEINEVWVKYTNSNHEDVFENLQKTENGLYYFFIDKDYNLDSEVAFNSFIPYFIDIQGKIVYYNTEEYLAFESSNIAIAEDSIQISSNEPYAEYCKYWWIQYKRPNHAICVNNIWATAWKCETGYVESRKSCILETEASICKLWSTNKYYVKPKNATCLPWNEFDAWTCNSWFEEKWNSCIRKISIQNLKILNFSNKWEDILIEDIVSDNSWNSTTLWMELAENIFKGAHSSLITYISDKVTLYWDNAPIMFSIIYEEQAHALPPIIEDVIWWDSVWLSQIRTPVPQSDKEYFWYTEYTRSELLSIDKHLVIMNDRINIIKSKLQEEWKIVTAENIWRAWNWWPSCVKTLGTCSDKAILYWERIKHYYPYFKNYSNLFNN